MINVLDKIVAVKHMEVNRLYELGVYDDLKSQALELGASSSFYQALKQQRVSLIAELKKASPSKGMIRPDFNPELLAREFQKAGASALSVLTDEQFFQGSLKNLERARDCVSIPLLRKEFVIDPIQIYEAKVSGASAVLLIASILTVDKAQSLINVAKECQLDVLMEVHNLTELEMIRTLDGLAIVGVNNRDLTTFQTDIQNVLTLAPLIRDFFGEDVCVVAESGYSMSSQIQQLEDEGIDAVLIGEGLATHPDLLSFWLS